MKTFEFGGKLVIIFYEEDLDKVKSIQENSGRDELVYINMDPVRVDTYLFSDRFLVENYEASFTNHLLWKGLFDSEEQHEYITECVATFIENGTQLYIEDYVFTEAEAFYDYSR